MRHLNKVRFIGVVLSALLVGALALPTVRWMSLRAPDGILYGYTSDLPPAPQHLVRAFLDKSLQRWVERYYDTNMGFRAYLIRTFNEVNFRLFREAPRLRLYATPDHGLYSKMPIDSLNEEVARHDQLTERYHVEAEKLLLLQHLLQAEGKDFQVIIATSKPYVYPQSLGARYLTGGSENIFRRAASFGSVLKNAGVNVIDGGPLLRGWTARSGVETHPDSGVHWNYYAGCVVASQMLDDIRMRKIVNTPRIDCGKPVLGTPHMVDVDGLDLLNIWSDGGIAKMAPYPTITQDARAQADMPKFVFISDSFVDQLRYPLQQAHAYSRLVASNYFHVREVVDPVTNVSVDPDVKSDPAVVHQMIAEDIAKSDVVVLEMVDYNVTRWEYGVPDYLLDYASKGGTVPIASTTGAYDRETEGTNWWNWVKNDVTFTLSPTLVPNSLKRATLRFKYSTIDDHTITITVLTRDGDRKEFVAASRPGILSKFEATIDLPPSKLAQVNIRANGKAGALGNGDPRMVAMRISNLAVNPILDASSH